MPEETLASLGTDDLRTLHLGVSMAVTIYDSVEEESGVTVGAPLYGKRDRLVELARLIDHEANHRHGPDTEGDRG